MKYATKMMVVPFTKQIQKMEDTYVEGLDKEMIKILNSSIDIPTKIKLYNQTLSKFIKNYDPNTFRIHPALTNISEQLTTSKIGLGEHHNDNEINEPKQENSEPGVDDQNQINESINNLNNEAIGNLKKHIELGVLNEIDRKDDWIREELEALKLKLQHQAYLYHKSRTPGLKTPRVPYTSILRKKKLKFNKNNNPNETKYRLLKK